MSPLADDELLDAAIRTFETEGWRHTTIERVAGEAGVPVADVMRRYPSREHLAVATWERVFEQLPDEFGDEIGPDLPLTDKLYFLLAHELRSLEPHKEFVRHALLDLFNPLSPTARLQMPLARRYTALAADLIRDSRARGEISRLTFPQAAALGFWLLRAQVVAYWLSDTSDASERTHAQADAWVDLFVRSLQRGNVSGLVDRITDTARPPRRRPVAERQAAEQGRNVRAKASARSRSAPKRPAPPAPPRTAAASPQTPGS